MTFQAYLDTIRSKTGKGPDDFKALAAAKGLLGPGPKAGEVTGWLKAEFGLGHGHAMAIYAILKAEGAPGKTADDRIGQLFSGGKAAWRAAYDELMARAQAFGADVGVSPTDTYVSLLRGQKKFAIVQPSAGRLDLGFKRRGAAPTGRFAAAGSWNAMVTHRARIAAADEIDADVLAWLRAAYDEAG